MLAFHFLCAWVGRKLFICRASFGSCLSKQRAQIDARLWRLSLVPKGWRQGPDLPAGGMQRLFISTEQQFRTGDEERTVFQTWEFDENAWNLSVVTSGAQLLLSSVFCSSCPVRSGSLLASSSDLQTRSQVHLRAVSLPWAVSRDLCSPRDHRWVLCFSQLFG